MKDALIRCTIPEERNRYLVGVANLRGERCARSKRHGCADNAVGTQNIERHVGHMHRTTHATTVATRLTHQLSEHPIHARALGNAVAVPPVIASDVVVWPKMKAHARSDSLFARIAMSRSLYNACLEQFEHFLLEQSDPDHHRVKPSERLGRHESRPAG